MAQKHLKEGGEGMPRKKVRDTWGGGASEIWLCLFGTDDGF